MTEKNMKKMYDHFIEIGNSDEAKKISDIPRYAKFKDNSGEKLEVKPKKVK